ncbi:MAG TPA: IPExxxVDY family protein [Flavobacterium sp.]|uniref:IPExxxVDY family protein n=1 Tax=Flavobacterium sp. TaxID=239 RepID=UPI002B917E55|nr:IPExxxVDY family protein [Flavobacterium sp.]HNP32541.1 IPExxxVDY family protein [Flavobacterium sp.]
MAVHKLHVDEYDEIDYQLIAIHTSLEDYLLAYCINQKLPVVLKKSDCDIQIRSKEGETQFTRFIFEDEIADVAWNLIQNKNDVLLSTQGEGDGLFAESKFSTNIYLIPEFKKVDYFLKIENGNKGVDVAKITKELKKIDRISTIYAVDVENIKSKNNLIF